MYFQERFVSSQLYSSAKGCNPSPWASQIQSLILSFTVLGESTLIWFAVPSLERTNKQRMKRQKIIQSSESDDRSNLFILYVQFKLQEMWYYIQEKKKGGNGE